MLVSVLELEVRVGVEVGLERGPKRGQGRKRGRRRGLDLVDEAVPALLRVRPLWLVQSAVDGVNVVELALVD